MREEVAESGNDPGKEVLQSIRSLADTLKNGFACVSFTFTDTFASPDVSPVEAVIQCSSGWVEFDGPDSAEIGRDSPLLGEVRRWAKLRFGPRIHPITDWSDIK